MKYEKEATTKNGRRTWKVTYELVRGPEPKPRRQAEKVAAGDTQKKPDKNEAKQAPAVSNQPSKPAPTKDRRKKGKVQSKGSQLAMF